MTSLRHGMYWAEGSHYQRLFCMETPHLCLCLHVCAFTITHKILLHQGSNLIDILIQFYVMENIFDKALKFTHNK